MTNMPERIWVEEPEIFDGMGFWQERQSAGLVQYVRADLVTPPQITDAMVEAAHLATLGRNWPSTQTMRAALAAAMGVKP